MKAKSTGGGEADASGAIRIDRLLVYLRFARTRSAALALIEAHALRRNRKHVLRGSQPVRIGDVLTIAWGDRVQVIELTALPDRRGSAAQSRLHYREVGHFREVEHFREVDRGGLDRKGQMPIASSPLRTGHTPEYPEDRC